MEAKKLEYRMYGLVPYNISPIQQGIQFGHAVVRYGRTVKGIEPYESLFNEWADNHETFIILNGGTTNSNRDKLGTLNVHAQTLFENGIVTQAFYEPDLGDQLTAIVFLIDERVFNKVLCPDFNSLLTPNLFISHEEREDYNKWVESIGGPKNAFLREFLKSFRLA